MILAKFSQLGGRFNYHSVVKSFVAALLFLLLLLLSGCLLVDFGVLKLSGQPVDDETGDFTTELCLLVTEVDQLDLVHHIRLLTKT